MPGPSRYNRRLKAKNDRVKTQASRGGRTASEAAFGRSMGASSSQPASTRKVAPVTRGSYGRKFQPTPSAIKSSGNSDRGTLGAFTSVVEKMAKHLTSDPYGIDKRLEPVMMAGPMGMVRGATVKGLSGLKSAVTTREAAKKVIARRAERASKAANRPANRAAARTNRRQYTSKKAQAKNERLSEKYMDWLASGDRADPPWVGKPELKGRIDTMIDSRKGSSQAWPRKRR
jgi:hypothetical protein